jgi:hypothetical protein
MWCSWQHSDKSNKSQWQTGPSERMGCQRSAQNPRPPWRTSLHRKHGINGSELPRSADDGGALSVKKASQRVKKWVRFIEERKYPKRLAPSCVAHKDALDCGSHRSRQGVSAPQHQGIDNLIDLEVFAQTQQ